MNKIENQWTQILQQYHEYLEDDIQDESSPYSDPYVRGYLDCYNAYNPFQFPEKGEHPALKRAVQSMIVDKNNPSLKPLFQELVSYNTVLTRALQTSTDTINQLHGEVSNTLHYITVHDWLEGYDCYKTFIIPDDENIEPRETLNIIERFYQND